MLKRNLMLTLLCVAFALLVAVPRNLVVVEVGTGTWCGYCPGAAMGCHDLLINGHPVAIIKNHNGDPYANTYSNARNSFYAITGYPTAWFDGLNPSVGGSATASMYTTYLPRVNARMAETAKYTISAMGSNSGDNYTVQVTVAKPEADSNTNIKLHAVLTESDIPVVWGNQTTVENVNRLMVPDQNGTAISLNTGGQTTIELNFTKQSAWVTDNCEIIFFLQNMTTKEILQGAKYTLTDLTGGYPLSLSSQNFQFLPAGGTESIPVTILNYASYEVNGTISTNNPAFTVSTGVYNIPAHGSQVFNLNFVPTGAEDYTGTMNLTGNLWNYPSIDIPLSGMGYELASGLDFAITNGTYTPVTDGSVLGSETTNNRWFTDPTVPLGSGTVFSGPGYPIGFDFNYLGRNFNQLGVHSYGWIGLGQSTLTPSVNLTTTASTFPLGSVAENSQPHLVSRIAALSNAIRPQTGSELRVVTIGEAPNRECVIQWTNFRRVNLADSFNFQIRLLENGNRIKLSYGNFSFANTNGLAFDVGLRNTPDIEASNFYNLTSTTNWGNPAQGTTTSSRMTLSSVVKPANGLTYTWTPQSSFPHAPLLVSPVDGSTGMPLTGFDLNWSPAPTGALPEYYAVYMSSDENAVYDQEYWETTSTSFDPVTDGGFTFGYDQRWFWTVQAFNASGTVLSVSTYRFDTESAPVNQIPEATVVTGGSLGWPVVAGAQSYNIYRADTPYGTYSLVGNTLDPNWQDPDFPASKAFYKVTAVLNGREQVIPTEKVRVGKTEKSF